MKELKTFRFELNRSINTYGKESVSADELLEALDLIIKAIDEKTNKPKQAVTSLIKELVAEAKPTNSVTQRGSVTVYGDLGERDLNIINQFEQNLLKALEEV